MKPVSLVAVLILACAAAFAQTPAISNNGIVNGASFTQGQPIAPGSLISIFGSNFGTGLAQADSVPLSTSLAGVSVTFNSVSAPMLAVIHTQNFDQLNVQLPWNVVTAGTTGPAQVVVTRNGASSTAASVQVTPVAPGLFNFLDSNAGVFRPIAYNNSDQTFAFAAGAIPGLVTRPAKVGDPTSLVLLATGLGPVNGTVPANGAPPPRGTVLTTTTNPIVTVGGVQTLVVFSGLSPEFPGVYQINVVLAANTPTGNQPIQISMGGITTSDQLKIAVSQ